MALKNNNLPKIFIISAPSGGGGDSVIEGLTKKIKFNRVITTVARKTRPGESQGKPYYFITVDKFKKMLHQKAFIEWAIVYGDYRGGTKTEITRLLKLKKPIIWKVDWQGLKAIKKILPNVVSILITTPSYQNLETRLIKRHQDSLAEIKSRKRFTLQWLKHKKLYDYIIINRDGQLAASVKKAAIIVKKELKKV